MKIKPHGDLSEVVGRIVKPIPGITVARGLTVVAENECGVIVDVRWAGSSAILTVNHARAFVEYHDFEIDFLQEAI